MELAEGYTQAGNQQLALAHELTDPPTRVSFSEKTLGAPIGGGGSAPGDGAEAPRVDLDAGGR